MPCSYCKNIPTQKNHTTLSCPSKLRYEIQDAERRIELWNAEVIQNPKSSEAYIIYFDRLIGNLIKYREELQDRLHSVAKRGLV